MNGRRPVDVHTFIGSYPFRHVPHPDPDVLVRVLAREGCQGAWVGHLPSAFHRDPTHGNEALLGALAPHGDVLRATPTIRPDWPAWERALAAARDAGAVAIRAFPPQWGMGPGDPSMARLASACGEAGVVLALTVRFEDLRQRHWMDSAGDLSAAAVRALARVGPRTHLVVAGAGRELIEEVHWGLTPDERARVWWDISWIWGPPEEHLAHLFRTVGSARFLHGTGWPLRLTQTPTANLELLPNDLRASQMAHADDVVRSARGET
jgi:predicted TIM-barrel fold metal-dependent hydrolase